jgi:AraC-like DNA-binding protein
MQRLYEAMEAAPDISSTIGVLEDFLKQRRRAVYPDQRLDGVAAAISLMEATKGNISCETLQKLTNTSRKSLERNFMNFHGIHPKEYLRIVRFNFARKVMEKSLESNLTGLAHNLGYFDQSHFIKEFKRFSGNTPRDYLKIIEEEHKKRSIPID